MAWDTGNNDAVCTLSGKLNKLCTLKVDQNRLVDLPSHIGK